MPAMQLPTIPRADVARHNTAKSCYVTIGANVYDVTNFVHDHPGGGDLILEYGGQDVEKIMQDELSHSHSEAAYEILEDSVIGFMATESIMEGVVASEKPDEIVPLIPNDAGFESLKAAGVAKDLQSRPIFERTGLSSPEDLSKPTDARSDFTKHKFLDLDKPLLMQVWNGGFSKDFYLEQVHRPRHYSKGPSAPLFGNFLEPLSKTAWYVVPIIWVPCVALGTWKANTGLSSGFETAAYWALGLALWSLVEYGMHRGLFHVDKYLPDNRVGITAHFLLHGIHHYLPMDRYRLVMPPTLFIVLAYPFWHLAQTVFYWDWYVATAVFCGGVFGYISYDLTHYFLHHRTLPGYYRNLKAYHLDHHYKDFENGFGVTSRFWDVVFGTELGPQGQAAKAA